MNLNDVFKFRFSTVSDGDLEDTVLITEPDFGGAFGFIQGKFPSYVLSPINNNTDIGVH